MLNQVSAMTVAEFCDKYRIDRASYYRNARLGRMPAAIKVGGSTRILTTDEEDWLAKQRAGSQEVAR
jgi:predicted site-specific integrase-resolvase